MKSINEVNNAEVEITFDPPWTQDLMSVLCQTRTRTTLSMAGEIANRVAKSPLITLLEEHYPTGERNLDLSQWLEQGFILREKEFRSALKTFDFSYKDAYVALYSTEALLRLWHISW